MFQANLRPSQALPSYLVALLALSSHPFFHLLIYSFFNQIASEILPMDIVHLLNELYSCIDEHIEIYEVYKVKSSQKTHHPTCACRYIPGQP